MTPFNECRKNSCRFTNWLPGFSRGYKLVRHGSASNWGIAFLFSIIVVFLLAYASLQLRRESGRHSPSDGTVRVYCAAGVVQPVETIIAAYNRQPFENRIEVVRTGGSGELAGQIKTEFETGLAFGAELYITADDELLSQAQQDGIVRERFRVAIQKPVIAVAADSGLSIASLAELVNRQDIRFGIASQGAAIGKITRAIARRDGVLQKLESRKSTDSENVMTLAQALVTGSLDAAIVWDTTVSQINAAQDNRNPTLRIAAMADPLDHYKSQIAIGVVTLSKKPAACLKFARYLTAPETGRQVFRDFGYSVAE